MEKAYSVLADYYDNLMTDFDYDKYYDFVRRYAKGQVLELASGSGVFTALLLSSASDVLAVDISSEMLAIAEKRNFRNRKYVRFIQASMLDFECMHKMDNAFCVCDGINYITPRELEALASRVSDNIKLGGHFVFDISSSYKLREIIGDNIFYEDTDDFTYLWTNAVCSESVAMDIAVFEKSGDVYTRRDEQHTQYIHEQDIVCTTLERAGFEVQVFAGDTFMQVQDTSKRLLFVCKKIN